jgi:hypothetical protein
MSVARNLILATAWAGLLAACAGQSETYQMNPGQSVTMPKGTMTGAASVGDMYAPKNVSYMVDERYHSVRIIAAYDQSQLNGT